MIESLDKLNINSDGFIVNEAGTFNVKEPFLSKVNWALLNYIYCEYNNAIFSAYLVGDIPRGIAHDKSNINLLIVLHSGNKILLPMIKNCYSKINNPYDFKVNPQVITYDDIFANNYGAIKWKFLIKTISTCIFGEDFASKIRPYTLQDANKIFE